MTNNILDKLKENLQPKGTKPLVKLFLKNGSYYDKAFIDSCIEEIEALSIKQNTLEPISSLQKLAIEVLLDSAYLK